MTSDIRWVAIMPVSSNYLQYALDLLKVLGPVSAKRMFGGAGLYLEGSYFALIADDVLFFRVDEANKADYLNAGTGPLKLPAVSSREASILRVVIYSHRSLTPLQASGNALAPGFKPFGSYAMSYFEAPPMFWRTRNS